MSHQIELKTIRALLVDAQDEMAVWDRAAANHVVPLITAVRMLTDIVESVEKDRDRPDTRPPPPAPPTDPGGLEP